MSDIAFRPLVDDDLVQLFQWLTRPHVRNWYAPEPTSFAEMAAKYRPRMDPASPVKAFMVHDGAANLGYIQAYPIDVFAEYARSLDVGKGVVGMDLYLGEPWSLGRGLGARVIRGFVEDVLFAKLGALACVAGPLEGNVAAIRAFQKAGFRRWKVVRNERGENESVMRRDRDEAPVRIDPIDLADAATCARFHRDMYLASFGTPDGLEEEMGPGDGGYLALLCARIEQIPEGNVHLRQGDRIVGQLEMRLVDDESHVAYVSLIYVLPESRGRGFGRRLHEHGVEVARRRGKRLMRLSVSLANEAAIEFYRRLGWRMAGAREHRLPMAMMEFPLD